MGPCCAIVPAALVMSASALAFEFHVGPRGDDANPGTPARPFATLARARDAVRDLKRNRGLPTGGVKVLVRGGRYFLTRPLTLGPADSGTARRPVVYAAFPGEKVVISGGRPVTGWRRAGPNRWTVTLPQVRAGRWYFRQLFVDGRRLTRARTPNEGTFSTSGALTKFQDLAGKRYGGYSGLGKLRLRATRPDAYCGFNFRPGDIKKWRGWPDAEIITYHSWECSWQTIRSIDLEKNDVHFNTPCRYPVGFFHRHMNYRVENVPEALDAAGEWHLDRGTGVLTYLARPGEEPPGMDFVAPVIYKLLVLEGSKESPVEYVTFSGFSFLHARYPLGIYDVAKDWPRGAVAAYPDWPKEFRPGYTDSQAAPLCGQTIELKDARHCTIEDCEIAHIGNYAIKIFRRGRHNRIAGCHIHDAGGGGVLIGMDVRDVRRAKVPPEDAPSHNTVANNVIRNVSLVHPSAVGIWVAQSHHNKIVHNEISDVGYAGVHIGWTWNRNPNYTRDNLVAWNNIHHVMRELADAGGIYTLGVQTGTVFRENHIHDIARARIAVGAPVNGIFFDQGTRDIRLERNVIRRVAQPVRFNQCKKEDQTWVDNDLVEGDRPPASAEGRIGRAALFRGIGMNVPHSPELEPEKLTVCAWVCLAGLAGGRRWVVGKNRDEWSDAHYSLAVSAGNAGAYVNVGGGKENRHGLFTTQSPLRPRQWHHLAFTYDGASLELYVDGTVAGRKHIGRKRTTGSGHLSIGERADGWKEGRFRGRIDDVRIYDRVLSAAEVARLVRRASAAERGGGLVGYWPLDGVAPLAVDRRAPGKEAGSAIDVDEIMKNAGLEPEYRRTR